MPIPGAASTQILDLSALSAYRHRLNAGASDEAIRRFEALTFIEKCDVAGAWAHGRDHVVDRRLHALNDETW